MPHCQPEIQAPLEASAASPTKTAGRLGLHQTPACLEPSLPALSPAEPPGASGGWEAGCFSSMVAGAGKARLGIAVGRNPSPPESAQILGRQWGIPLLQGLHCLWGRRDTSSCKVLPLFLPAITTLMWWGRRNRESRLQLGWEGSCPGCWAR